jgi:alkyl hydroperoxide reductase subunit AhpC
MESCDFRDFFPRFVNTDAVVLGISPDGVKSHQKFKKKYKLPFTLLVDENHALAERLGIWVEKLFYGRRYMGVRRTTYIIGPDGNVRHVFEKVDPDGHAHEVMAFLAGGVEAARAAREEYDARVLAQVPAGSKPVAAAAGKKPAKKKPAKKKPAKKIPARKKASRTTARHGK